MCRPIFSSKYQHHAHHFIRGRIQEYQGKKELVRFRRRFRVGVPLRELKTHTHAQSHEYTHNAQKHCAYGRAEPEFVCRCRWRWMRTYIAYAHKAHRHKHQAFILSINTRMPRASNFVGGACAERSLIYCYLYSHVYGGIRWLPWQKR